MNKKFSTLVAALLLSGALCSVQATDVAKYKDLTVAETTFVLDNIKDNVLEFTGDVTLPDEVPFLVINQNNLTIDGNGYTFTGRIVVLAENVTIKNLNIVNDPKVNGGSCYKNAITLAAASGTITGCTIDCKVTDKDKDKADNNLMANGIVIFPTKADAKYSISGNTIKNAYETANDNSESAGLLVADGITPSGLPSGLTATSATLSDKFDLSSVTNNTYELCATDYSYDTWGESVKTHAIRVTPLTSDMLRAATYLNPSSISYLAELGEDAEVIFNGTAEELLEAFEVNNVNTSSANVAIQCSDANVVYGTVELPDNGLATINASIKPLADTVYGYELFENETSEYGMLILRSNNNGAYYAATVEGGVSKVVELTSQAVADQFASDKASLWKMSKGTQADGSIYYVFTNQNGDKLAATGTAGTGTANNAFFPVNNAAYYNGVVFDADGLTLNVAGNNYFGLYAAGNQALTVGDLNWYEKDGFGVTIYYDTKDDDCFADAHLSDAIAGNPFVGHLTPMSYVDATTGFAAAADNAEQFYLANADGEFIVAEKYASNGSNARQTTFTFKAVKEADLVHDIARAALGDEQQYYGLFRAYVSAKYTDMKKLSAIDVLQVKLSDNGNWSNIGRLDLTSDEVPTLAASKATALKPILISLGSNQVVNPKNLLKYGKFFTVERSTDNGKTWKKLAERGDEYNDSWWVTKYGNVLEGQWALTIEDGSYKFTNRESFAWYKIGSTSSLYTSDTENVYRMSGVLYKIVPVSEHSESDGYTTLKDLKNTKFNIGFVSEVFGLNAWFTENHDGVTNHTIGLDTDADNALIFDAVEYSAARGKEENTDHTYSYIPSDSIYVISTIGYYAGNTYKTMKDTLKVVSYSFVNQFVEPLVYNWNDAKYESRVYADPTKKLRYETVAAAHVVAQKFALRLDNGKLNLRPVYHYNGAMNEFALNEAKMHQAFNSWDKVYAGDATKGILTHEYLYDRTENDLFVVEPTEKAMYRRIANDMDTVAIFRNDNPMSVLFEKGAFLGMENAAQFELAPAMLADTAYVRYETYRPQYMLVVNPTVVPEGTYCPIHGVDATCEHATTTKGWVEGRYLVNLVDTAIVWDIANKHKGNNPYINSEKYYRLGFVDAKHIGDDLVILGTDDTLNVGTPDYNQAKFAFRYVDQEAGSFVIETANYKRLPNVEKAEKDGEGYIKWMNGVVVVVDNIKNADVFNMIEGEVGDPTANEEVAAAEVSVIAQNGAIIVKGAAGKVITVANILGQTIANQVAASDNVTIAAPAGVAVVTVDGEATKVIVK
ncbi:MAG: DUF6383 domain-containing protein [Parabacteroides sp.]